MIVVIALILHCTLIAPIALTTLVSKMCESILLFQYAEYLYSLFCLFSTHCSVYSKLWAWRNSLLHISLVNI